MDLQEQYHHEHNQSPLLQSSFMAWKLHVVISYITAVLTEFVFRCSAYL